jgi:hypothetical protein
MKDLLPHLVDFAIPVVTILLAWLSTFITRWIRAKVHNEYIAGALLRLHDAVVTAVKAVDQTMVDELRDASADGKISSEEAERLKAAAVEAVKAYIGQKGMTELRRIFDSKAIERLIEDKIEAFLSERKDKVATALLLSRKGNDDNE